MLCLTMTLADYLEGRERGFAASLAAEIGVYPDRVAKWKQRGAVIDSDGSVRSFRHAGWLHAYKVPSLITANYELLNPR